jgi:putative CocE/NonD family hydrolase
MGSDTSARLEERPPSTAQVAGRPSRLTRQASAVLGRRWHLPPRRNKVRLSRDVQVPMRDGVVLLADHYAPVTNLQRPTVLMRCPYGRGQAFAMLAMPFAERGYHVLLQSTRGTFGSGGTFRPAVDEAADGQDTVAWLRTQDWFDGRLGTVGASYLAFAQWALALDPPPELKAMVVQISPHDLASAGYPNGVFELYNLLMWSDLMAHQEQLGAIRGFWRTARSEQRLAAALRRLPLRATGDSIGGAGAPWYGEWLNHPDMTDSFWDGYRAGAALDLVTVPTLLISGFHDFFVEQTLQQYQALRSRGVPAALTIGPWTHMTIDGGVTTAETLGWLDAYLDANGPAPRSEPVRAWTSGLREWRDLPQWPPPGTAHRTWYLRAPGALSGAEPAEGATQTSFSYDPAAPTPAVGGRTMSMTGGGSKDNTALERRDDVLTFSTPPLPAALQVAGRPVVDLWLRTDPPHANLFARLCDVDERGRSRNLTDQIVRLPIPADRSADGSADGPADGPAQLVSMALPDMNHVFLAGHLIRLQLSGGAHPRFARNLGTGDDPVDGSATAVVRYDVQHSREQPSALSLPVLGQPNGHPDGGRQAGR